MRARNREFNILNMSFLDVICGAMGAFLIVMVILMPYYKKEAQDFLQSIGNLKQELAETTQRLEETELELAKVRRELNQQINASLFGLAIREKKIVVLLDLSGSLSGDNKTSQGNPCIGCVKALKLSIKEIAKLDETFEIGLIGFHAPLSKVNSSVVEPRLLYWPAEGKIKSMDNQGKSSFIAEAKTLLENVKGGTPTQMALLRALDYPTDGIILLTDGAPTIPDQSWQTVVKVVTQKNNRLKKPMAIHTVAVGNYKEKADFVDFLGDLSRKNNGEYIAMFAPPTP